VRMRGDPGSDTSGAVFREALAAGKASHPFGWAVDDRGPEFFENPRTRLFLTPEGDAGAGPAPWIFDSLKFHFWEPNPVLNFLLSASLQHRRACKHCSFAPSRGRSVP